MRARVLLATTLLVLGAVVVAVSAAAGVLPGGHQPRSAATTTPRSTPSTVATTSAAASAVTVSEPAVELPLCQQPQAALTDIPEGPATGHITGAAVTSRFDFTRDLTLSPPPAGYRPVVTRDQALCQLESAVSNGPPEPGVVALATVTLRGHLPAGVAPYQSRVAWVLVGYSAEVTPSCPPVIPEPSAVASPEWPTPRGGPEQVTAIDARTGGSGVYVEEHHSCDNNPPAPTVGIPLQVNSLPWTAGDRSADGTSATLHSAWPSCAAFAGNEYEPPPLGSPTFALGPDQQRSGVVPVRVWQPLGPRCGPDVPHDVTVTSVKAGVRLPARLVPAPVGVETRAVPQTTPLAVPGPATSPPPVMAKPGSDSCADPAGANALLLADAPPGPAQGKTAGAIVSQGWSLDDGGLVVGPPPSGYVATVGPGVAGCRLAFASRADVDPVSAGKLELGTVTVAPNVGLITAGTPRYDHRVAWLLVTSPASYDSCTRLPSEGPGPYEVLAIDAATGRSAMAYEQAHLCGRQYPPSIGLPNQSRSVPWRLLSRAHDGSTVTIAASWTSCETFRPIYQQQVVLPNGQLRAEALRDNPTEIRIRVSGQLGIPCGPTKAHTVVVGPATAGTPISAIILHSTVGALEDSVYP